MWKRLGGLAACIACSILILVIVAVLRREKAIGRADAGPAPRIVTTQIGIEMALIPGGWFEMGSEKNDESPVHKVWIDPFLMDRHEVTQAAYYRFPLSESSHFKDPKNPAAQILWTDAVKYCNERSRAEGLEPCYDKKADEKGMERWDCHFEANGYRLPTEAEWEYACRAGVAADRFPGDDARNMKRHAWFKDNSAQKAHQVGTKQPNPWGLYDMQGNVAEWCNDFYAFYDEDCGDKPQKNPRGPVKGRERVLRGGAWNSSADACRSSRRVGDASVDDDCLASDAIGFRCVRKAPPAQPGGKTPAESVSGPNVGQKEAQK